MVMCELRVIGDKGQLYGVRVPRRERDRKMFVI